VGPVVPNRKLSCCHSGGIAGGIPDCLFFAEAEEVRCDEHDVAALEPLVFTDRNLRAPVPM
jgi:hypothetical protein